MLGLAWSAIRLLTAGLWTWRLVQRAALTEHPALPELARRFRCRLPRLARSSEIDSPMLAFGTILLPQETATDERLILAHEMAHFQRRDLAWEWLGVLTQTLLWFHPLVWLARREERSAREGAADALAIARTAAAPADYARALLAASLRRNGRPPTLAVGAVEGGSHLRRRLEALARPGLPRRRAIALGGVACIAAILAFLPWRAVARQQVAAAPLPPTTGEAGGASRGASHDPDRPIPNAKVFGWVTEPSGKPIPNMLVDGALRNTYWGYQARTDRNGRYEIAVPTGEVTIMVDLWNRKNVVARVDRPTRLDFTHPRFLRARIRGRVVDRTGKPVAGIVVSIQSWKMGTTETTDSQGRFYWRAEGASRIPLTIYAQRGAEGAYATIFPDDRRLTLRLSEASVGHFTGRIVDEAGKPIRNPEIGAEQGNIGFGNIKAPIDAQGRFRIPALPEVPYRFAFRAAGYGMRTIPVRFDIDRGILREYEPGGFEPVGLQVKAGESHDLGTVALTGGMDTATGRLLNAHHKPITPAVVYLTTKSGTWEGNTDASGRFTLKGVLKGEQGSLFVIGFTGKAEGYVPYNWLRRGIAAGDMGTIVLTNQDFPLPEN
jgi:hypothetical protein